MAADKIGRDKFLKLPTGEIRRLVIQSRKPRTGIFTADGNRRLVMTQTGLTPASVDFYPAYLKITTKSFKKNLAVFFDHGLETLFFPLFGPSLLTRGETYCRYVMPELVRTLFQSDEWISVYKEYGIRIKAYGNVRKLGDSRFNAPDLEEIIKQGESRTCNYENHRLFYGFFSSGIYNWELIQKVNRFIQDYDREPDRAEMAKLYYGEEVSRADFFITSTKTAGLEALPPLAYGKNTLVYTLAVPGVWGLNEKTYREILYDLLYLSPGVSTETINDTGQRDIELLKDFYQQHRNKVSGLGKRIGKFRVPEFKNCRGVLNNEKK